MGVNSQITRDGNGIPAGSLGFRRGSTPLAPSRERVPAGPFRPPSPAEAG